MLAVECTNGVCVGRASARDLVAGTILARDCVATKRLNTEMILSAAGFTRSKAMTTEKPPLFTRSHACES
jgi:hypothetical protein